jgi:hypothetical protein
MTFDPTETQREEERGTWTNWTTWTYWTDWTIFFVQYVQIVQLVQKVQIPLSSPSVSSVALWFL